MRVLNSISSMGLHAGGPSLTTILIVMGLRNMDVDVQILSYAISTPTDRLIHSGDFLHLVPSVSNTFFYSCKYKRFIATHRDYDLYHAQGLWLYPTYITAKLARRFGKPYVITPHGMLYPQDLAKGRLKKSIFLKLFLMNDLQKAACIQATCREEMEHIRALGVTSPIAVIPNPIDTARVDEPVVSHDLLRVGYLGRVHPRKNIERLLYAWEKLGVQTGGRELVIIGDGDKAYMNFLLREKERLGLKNVIFTGFLSGQAKEDAVGSLSYLAVPSDFENFGMIVAEALVRGIPVICTKGAPWEELETHKCGWWVDNDVDTLASAMAIAFAVPETERKEMGYRAKKLIKDRYSIPVIASQMKQLYGWVLHGGEAPGFVHRC